MNKIRYYLDNLFSDIPPSRELDSLKADILRDMEDRYWDVMKEGMSEQQAAGKVIAEFKSIEKIAGDLKKKSSSISNYVNLHETNEAEVLSFLELRKHAGGMVGLGILTILIATGAMILFIGLFPESDLFIVMGIILFMLSIPASIALFLYQGFKIFRNNYF